MKMIIDSKLNVSISTSSAEASLPWAVVTGRGIPSGRYETEAAAVYALLESVPGRIHIAHEEIKRLAARRVGIAAAFDEELIAGYANGILHIRALVPHYEALARDLAELRKADEDEDKERALYYDGEVAKSRRMVAITSGAVSV